MDAIWATKTVTADVGLAIALDPAAVAAASPPGAPAAVVAHTDLPREGDRESKVAWRDAVGRQAVGEIAGPVWLDVAVCTGLSLAGLLSPIIDGLQALLGVDPRGRLEFVPNDDRVEWLRVSRDSRLPCALVLAAGPVDAIGVE